MFDTVSFFVPLKSVPTVTAQQKGVRMVNGKIVHYTKPEVRKARDTLRRGLMPHVEDHRIPKGTPVALSVTWCFDIKGKHRHGEPHMVKPDADNITKLLLDVMTELCFWDDDCQVYKLTIMKVWQSTPGIFIAMDTLGITPGALDEDDD